MTLHVLTVDIPETATFRHYTVGKHMFAGETRDECLRMYYWHLTAGHHAHERHWGVMELPAPRRRFMGQKMMPE